VVRKQKKGKEKEEKINSKYTEPVEIYTGTFTNGGKNYTHEFIDGKRDNELLTESIARWLWTKYCRTKLSENWDNETLQRKLQWVTDAENLRGLVDKYYEE
jgi:hypothetical protein